MNKYRIVKRGDTDTYIVQRKLFGIFWITVVGNVFQLNLDEARQSRIILEDTDRYNAALKKKNTVVE